MRIDSNVEPLVRQTLAAVIARNPERSTGAIQALVDQGDETYEEAVGLCFAVDDQVLRDLHDGPPRPENIASLAESAAQMEAWAAIDEQGVQTFMTALAEARDPAAAMLPSDATTTGFVVGGWLLSASAPENTSWETVLDTTLASLAEVPDGVVIQGPWPAR